MANITVQGASYSDVPALDLPKTGGGTARFYEVSGSWTFSQNGTFDVMTLAEAVIDVPAGGGGATVGTKTATASNYPTSLSFTGLSGEPIAFFLRLTTQVSSSGSTTYYYIVNVQYDGTNVTGNLFRIGSTRRVQNVTSGYSFTYSNGTLTIRSSASSRSSSPGAFYSGEYELVYIYE